MKPKLPFITGPAETPPASSRRTAPQPLGKAGDYGVTDLSNIELEQVKGGWLGKFLRWLTKPIGGPRPEWPGSYYDYDPANYETCPCGCGRGTACPCWVPEEPADCPLSGA